MSNIPNAIAGSLSQAALQQSQAARSGDAQRNRDTERTRKMRELLEKHTSEVEDADQVDPKDMRVRQQQQAEEEHQRKREQAHEDQRNNIADDGESHQIDLQA